MLACMDGRLRVQRVLALAPGDARIFRNAGGMVTDDVIRSAVLTVGLFGTREIIVLLHTECGILGATREQVTQRLEEKFGLDIKQVPLDSALPEFHLPREAIHRWRKMHTDIDEAALAQAELLRVPPLIPKEVRITAYVYEIETGQLRRPGDIFAALGSEAFSG